MADQKAAKKREAKGYLGVFKVRLAAAAQRAKVGDTDGIDNMIDAMIERGTGRAMAHTAEGTIYAIPPDPAAVKLLIEMGFGKAKETVEITDPNDKFRGLPQLILVPPAGWTGEKKK